MSEEVYFIEIDGRKIRVTTTAIDPGRDSARKPAKPAQARLLLAKASEPAGDGAPEPAFGRKKARAAYITYGRPGAWKDPSGLLEQALTDYRKRFGKGW